MTGLRAKNPKGMSLKPHLTTFCTGKSSGPVNKQNRSRLEKNATQTAARLWQETSLALRTQMPAMVVVLTRGVVQAKGVPDHQILLRDVAPLLHPLRQPLIGPVAVDEIARGPVVLVGLGSHPDRRVDEARALAGETVRVEDGLVVVGRLEVEAGGLAEGVLGVGVCSQQRAAVRVAAAGGSHGPGRPLLHSLMTRQ